MTTQNLNTPNKKSDTNTLARDIFVGRMNDIGAEILFEPRKNGGNYVVRYKGKNKEVRVRGTKEMGVDIHLIRANRDWFETGHEPDVFYIVSGPRYHTKKQYIVSVNDARKHAVVTSKCSDGAVSFMLSYDDAQKLHNETIFGE